MGSIVGRTRARPSGRGRAGRTVSGAAIGALVLLGAAGTATAAPRQDPAPSEPGVTVSHTPDEQQVGCLPALLAVSHAIEHTESTFTLRITTSAPLCDPVAASAAIYAMPGNGVAWPQDLIELADFTLDAAGLTEVTFSKTCRPTQFDVITGAAPQRISPWGDRHGPLLFPFDMDTAFQHWGTGCAPAPTTTTTSTTTTAPPAATSSTLPPTTTTTTSPEVLSVSDEDPPTDEPPAVEPEVLGTTETAGPAALALTGAGFSAVAVGGVVLLLGGLLLAEAARRRSTGDEA